MATTGGDPEARVPSANRFALVVAALGPLGFSPVVPATVASLAIALGYAFMPPLGPIADALVFLAVTPVAIWAAGQGERAWGHDSRHIVIDEGAGMAATLFALPAGRETALLAFFAFRVFDVLKPFPGRRAERLPGGLGVVADDVIAGIYANLAVRAVLALMARSQAV